MVSLKNITKVISLIITFNILLFAQDDFGDDFGDEETTDSNEQLMNISGTITDAGSGRALAGANIIVDGTELGAAADESGPGKIKTDALEKLRKHNVAQQNIRYVESPGAPFWRDDRTLIDDPLGTIDVTTGKPLQVSNIASADIGQQIMGEKDWKTFSTRYGVNPTGTYGEASLRAVGRSALGRGAGKFGTMIGGQIASSYISDALADPMSRPGIVVSGGETESPQGMYIQNLVDYQSQGYTGKGDLNSLYYAPFYDNTSIAYQTLFQQAYANDPYGIEQSLMRAGIGNR